MKIMLVEDDYTLNKVMTQYLRQKNNEVHSFLSGFEAFESIEKKYDIFIIDVDVPEVNGIELLKKIKENFTNAHTLMISATVDIEVIEEAYNLGCSDYIKKPFDTKEIELKLKLLKNKIETKYQLTKNCFYDFKTAAIIVENKKIELTKKESKLLYLLVNNKGKIVSLEQIINTVWNGDGITSQIRQLVSRLNKKLPLDIIKNRPSQGYIIN